MAPSSPQKNRAKKGLSTEMGDPVAGEKVAVPEHKLGGTLHSFLHQKENFKGTVL